MRDASTCKICNEPIHLMDMFCLPVDHVRDHHHSCCISQIANTEKFRPSCIIEGCRGLCSHVQDLQITNTNRRCEKGHLLSRYETDDSCTACHKLQITNTRKEFELMQVEPSIIDDIVINCQRRKHVQQVAYTTYHGGMTQICFTCEMIRRDWNE